MIKVDSNVPVPQRGLGGRPEKYPFTSMKVGESFFIPTDEVERTRSAVLGAARLRLGAGRVATRVAEGGLRVWRIKE